MTGNKQALQIVLNNDRDPGCTEKLAMTRAWGDRYRAEATGYMRRKAYYFKRNFWAMNIAHTVDFDNSFPVEGHGDWKLNKETGRYEREIADLSDFDEMLFITHRQSLAKDPMDFPPASEANEWEKKAKDSAERYEQTKQEMAWAHAREESYILEKDMYEQYAMEPESPEFESALAEAEDQMLRDSAMEPEW